MLNEPDADAFALSVTVTFMVTAPKSAGVPDRTPPLESVSPAGTVTDVQE